MCVYPGSVWANPYKLKDYTIEESLCLYRVYLEETGLLEKISELKDKNLGCFCDQNNQCHAQILDKLAN